MAASTPLPAPFLKRKAHTLSVHCSVAGNPQRSGEICGVLHLPTSLAPEGAVCCSLRVSAKWFTYRWSQRRSRGERRGSWSHRSPTPGAACPYLQAPALTSLRNCSADVTGLRLISRITSPPRQARIFRRAARLYLCNRDSLYIRGQVQLLAHIRSEIGDRDAQPGVTRLVVGCCRDFLVLVVFANGQVNLLGVAVPHHVQLDLRARRIFADDHLQITSCFHRLAVHSGNHIALLQAGAARGRVGSYRSNQCPGVSSQVEELRVVRSYIVQSNSQVSMMNHAILDQRSRRPGAPSGWG